MQKRGIWLTLILAFGLTLVLVATAQAAATPNVLAGGIAINEILIDPNSATLNFDTDGNGTADDRDEFVEIYNLSGAAIDIGDFKLWDSGNGVWFTFPTGTMLGAGNFAVVVCGVQTGGSLPPVTGGNLAFNAARGSSVINNSGDDVVLYDPNLNQYIQLIYNNDPISDPTPTFPGATLVGSVENWGSDTDGTSRVRYPAGDSNIVNHNTISPDLASPGSGGAFLAVSLQSIQLEGATLPVVLLVSVAALFVVSLRLVARRQSR